MPENILLGLEASRLSLFRVSHTPKVKPDAEVVVIAEEDR